MKKRWLWIIAILLYGLLFVWIYNWDDEVHVGRDLHVDAEMLSENISPEVIYKQTFKSDKPVNGLSIRFSTQGKCPEGIYYVKISDSETDEFLDMKVIVGSDIVDGDYWSWWFEDLSLDPGREYYFTVNRDGDVNIEGDDAFALWMGDGGVYSDGELFYGGQDTAYDVDFKLIEDSISRKRILLGAVTLLFFLVIISLAFKPLRLAENRAIVLIYFLIFLFCGYKLYFYSSHVSFVNDELQHISYIAYLEKNPGTLIPDFEDMTILTDYDFQVKENPYDNVVGFIEPNGIYEGKFTQAVNYLGHPPLYYHVMRLAQGISFDGDKVIVNLFRLRAFSGLFFLISLGLLFYIGYTRIRKVPAFHLLYALMITSVPAMCHIGSGVSNDTFAFLGVSIFMLGAIRFAENNRKYGTYWIIALGVFITLLAKTTAGIIVLAGALVYIVWTCIRERSAKFLVSRYFLCTLPVYFIVLAYFLLIHSEYGTFQPALLNIAPEQFYNNTLVYVEPSERTILSLGEFIQYFFSQFFGQWSATFGNLPNAAGLSVFSLRRIGLMFMWVVPVVLFITSFKRRDSKRRLCLSLYAGILVTVAIQFMRAYRDFNEISGHAGTQSRYYMCVAVIFALAAIYILEAFMDQNSTIRFQRKRSISVQGISVAICIIYSIILYYEDFIYYLINVEAYIG